MMCAHKILLVLIILLLMDDSCLEFVLILFILGL